MDLQINCYKKRTMQLGDLVLGRAHLTQEITANT
jgi:hypothetical protein